MDNELTLSLAFLAGIAGAGHCLTMCGGLIGGAGMACGRRWAGADWRAHVAYHLGRILAYAVLGGLAAALGNALVLSGPFGLVQGVLYVVAGLAIMGVGLASLGLRFWRRIRPAASNRQITRGAVAKSLFPLCKRGNKGDLAASTQSSAPKIPPSPIYPRMGAFSKGGAISRVTAGALNGLMPCALVFSLTLKAATAASIMQGAAWLFAFGLGTLPAMALTGALGHWLRAQPLRWLRRVAGLALLALGIQAILAGAEFFRVMRHLA
ncbi:MAG: sulfite exporter TauE/SafE family protein [Hydrogenophilales bacterium]|nr:sulfite exporter TauE/SafE family protein [Hydrogenophilales bacterium]